MKNFKTTYKILSTFGLATGLALTPSNNGYWLLKKDGAVNTYGDAPYKGGANP